MHQPMTAQVVGGPLPRYEIYYAEDEAPGGIRRGAWKDGVCDWWRQWVPTCCAAMACSPCLTARFYDQFVKRGRYAAVLAGILLLSVLQSTFNNAATGIAIDAMAANATANGTAPSSTDVPSDLPPQPWPMQELMRDPTYRAMVWLTNLTGLALTILSVYCLYQARKAIRARFSIPGSALQDCCLSFWCGCCVLSQMYRHVRGDARGDRCCDACDCEGLGPAREEDVMNV